MLWNAKSARNKTINIADNIIENDVDIMVLTETWLKEEDQVKVGELTPPGCSFLDYPRGASTYGGGIGIIFKSDIKLANHPTRIDTRTFEHARVVDKTSGVNFTIVYRPPPSKENGFKSSEFLPEFDQFMHEMYITHSRTVHVLLGDFNVHVDETTSEATKFMDCLQSFGLKQYVCGPTHTSGHTLDLLIADPDDNLIRTCNVLPSLGSDHHLIDSQISIEKPKPSKLTKSIRNLKAIDVGDFKEDLASKLNNYASNGDADAHCDFFVSTLTEVLDKHAPSKQCSRSTRTRSPWYNNEIHGERRERRKLERRWRKDPNEENHTLYLEQNSKVVKLITNAKTAYYKEVLEEADSKSMYQTVNQLLNKGKCSKPICESPQILANDFADFFVSKVAKIREGLDRLPTDNALSGSTMQNIKDSHHEVLKCSVGVHDVKHIKSESETQCKTVVSDVKHLTIEVERGFNDDDHNVKHAPSEVVTNCRNKMQYDKCNPSESETKCSNEVHNVKHVDTEVETKCSNDDHVKHDNVKYDTTEVQTKCNNDDHYIKHVPSESETHCRNEMQNVNIPSECETMCSNEVHNVKHGTTEVQTKCSNDNHVKHDDVPSEFDTQTHCSNVIQNVKCIPSDCEPKCSNEVHNVKHVTIEVETKCSEVHNVKHVLTECEAKCNDVCNVMAAPSGFEVEYTNVYNIHEGAQCGNDVLNRSTNHASPNFHTFKQVTQEHIYKIIMGLSNKCCVLDPLPMWLFKECLPELLPTITNIVNESLTLGVFPSMLREAVVLPLLKKSSLDPNEYKNYRPVSNICYISKIIEKVVAEQINDHMCENNLNEQFQSAYRSRHSTETALLRVKNDIMLELDNNRAVLLVLLDLSSAFDTVDHSVLYDRMQNTFNISGTVLNWIRSYLTNRTFKVLIDNCFSHSQSINYGMPQGSVVSPMFFTYYTHPIGQILRKHHVCYHSYADDTQIYVSFDPRKSGEAEQALEKLTSCIEELKTWMTKNKLQLNSQKTEFFIAGTTNTLKKVPTLKLTIGDVEVEPSDYVKNLGVSFDPTMSMTRHINSVCRAVNFHLRNIYQIRRFIDFNTCNNITRSLVISRIDYANSLLAGLKSNDIKRLQVLQNRAARLVFQRGRGESAGPLLRELHWLPVRERILFKVMLMVQKCLSEKAPSYLIDCLTRYVPGKPGLRSAADNTRLSEPRTRLISAGDRAFASFAPREWNKLPTTIRSASSTATFKKKLKTHYFPS